MPQHLLSVADLGGRGHRPAACGSPTPSSRSAERPIPKVPALRGKNVVWLFYEDSTRTRLSFEQAAKRLSADTMNFSVGSSSVKKGESLRDTVLTIEAMGVDAIVVRHRSAGVPVAGRPLGRRPVRVVNAGDGWHEHPTQALLDCYTIRQHLEVARRPAHRDHRRHQAQPGGPLRRPGVHDARAPRSRWWRPPTLLPPNLDGLAGHRQPRPRRRAGRPRRRLPPAHAAERMTEHLVPSLREYTARFGLNRRRVDCSRDDALVMHPGPMNRGVEIAPRWPTCPAP